jgi:hypothetical protein
MITSGLPSNVALLIATGSIVGCQQARDAGLPAIRDSLGVTIIDYPVAFDRLRAPDWPIDAEPVFSYGDSAELYGVRTAVFQSDGDVVIANGGNHQLLFVDRSGRVRAQVGRAGGGPGEFQQLTSVSVGPGDSVYAYDGRERRLSVFDPAGRFVRAFALEGLDTLGSVEEVGVLQSGEITGGLRRRTQGTGLVRDSLGVVVFDPTGMPVRLLAVFPHLYLDWGPHPIPGGEGIASFPLPVPLSSVTALAVANRAVYVALPDQSAIIQLDSLGERRVTRAPLPPHSIAQAERDRFFATLRVARLDPRELDALRAIRGPDIRPAFGIEPLSAKLGEAAVVVSDSGAVWLRPFRLPGDTLNGWLRLGPDGLYDGRIVLPMGFRPTAVRRDEVLGVQRDSMDVEHIRAYRIRRGH